MTIEDRGEGDALPARRTASRPEGLAADAAVTSSDLEDARGALADAEKRAGRHLLWAANGLSPAALVPFVGLLLEGSVGLVVVLLFLVFLIESWLYLRATSEAQRQRAVVERLLAGHPDEP